MEEFNFIRYISNNPLLKEIEDASSANLAALDAEKVEDLSFKFKSKKGPTPSGVLSHDIITIEVFNAPGKKNIQLSPYHLIFGESSVSIFDALGVNETAGLTREGAEEHIKELETKGQNETYNGAYIAGLCNWAGTEVYEFINVGRAILPGYAWRVIPHESLHMTRMLITMEANEYVRTNAGKDKWWEDERAKFVNMNDENEEYFAEVLERVSAIAYDRWENVKGDFQLPPKPEETTPLKPEEYKNKNIEL